MKENHNVFNLLDEIGTSPQVVVHWKLCVEVPFFVCLYAIKEEKTSYRKSKELSR